MGKRQAAKIEVKLETLVGTKPGEVQTLSFIEG